ncbi:MAG: hypothetical protein JRG79_00125 [Deltaproteobacteria bacterium]|nr:hypothetical protein [Deltaproteobacteria bacterium]
MHYEYRDFLQKGNHIDNNNDRAEVNGVEKECGREVEKKIGHGIQSLSWIKREKRSTLEIIE